MAKSKRLKKKQQKKAVEKQLSKKGYTKKQVKSASQREKEKALKAAKLSERGKARTREMIKIGVPVDIRKKVSRTTAEAKYQSLIKPYKKIYQSKRRVSDRAKELPNQITFKAHTSDAGVLILWRDVTENVGKKFINGLNDEAQKIFEEQGIGYLYRSAYGFSQIKVGEIGQYQVIVTPPADLYRTMAQYPSYIKIYYGAGERYEKLLMKIRTMLIALYQEETKREFLTDLVMAFEKVNNDVAKKIKTDFDLELK